MYVCIGRGLARDSELCPLCIIVSNNVLDLNCNCSLSMLFGCVLLCLYILYCSAVLSLRLLAM